jgi:hypothetical protein
MWGALSDERTGLSFTMLLAFASAIVFGSDSRGTRDHILLSQIRHFPFRRLLRLAGLRWRYSTPPPHGRLTELPNELPFITWCGPETEHPSERFVCCNLRIRCHGNVCLPNRCPATVYSALPRECVFTECCLAMDNSGFQASCHNNISKIFQSNTYKHTYIY